MLPVRPNRTQLTDSPRHQGHYGYGELCPTNPIDFLTDPIGFLTNPVGFLTNPTGFLSAPTGPRSVAGGASPRNNAKPKDQAL